MTQQGNPDQAVARGGPLKVVGRRGPNIDAIERVTGQAKYTGDIELPGMLLDLVGRFGVHIADSESDDVQRQLLEQVQAIELGLDLLGQRRLVDDARLVRFFLLFFDALLSLVE